MGNIHTSNMGGGVFIHARRRGLLIKGTVYRMGDVHLSCIYSIHSHKHVPGLYRGLLYTGTCYLYSMELIPVNNGSTKNPDYEYLYASMTILRRGEAAAIAHMIEVNASRYRTVADKVSRFLPWQFIGLTHQMECSGDFTKHIHNGDSLKRRTVKVPVGRPVSGDPPFTWEESAVDAFTYQRFGELNAPLTVAAMLERLERYNGFGYRNRGIYSPYLWAGTNHYISGKYKEVLRDPAHPLAGYKSVYDSRLVSKQIGCAPVLKLLME